MDVQITSSVNMVFVRTQRCFDVHLTSIALKNCWMDVKITYCVNMGDLVIDGMNQYRVKLSHEGMLKFVSGKLEV